MISKIKSGILSCIGLIIITLLRGFIMIPNLELDNFIIYAIIIQVGYVWFAVSLWMVMRYDLVKLNKLDHLKKPLDWLVRNLAMVAGIGIIIFLFPNRELYLFSGVLGIILLINYIIVFVRIYRLDKDDLEFVGDLHNYILSMLMAAFIVFIINVVNEITWHYEIDYLLSFMSALPNLFILRFLMREKKDIEKKLKAHSIE